MSKAVTIADIYPVIEEKFHAGGSVTLMASGISMLPMLRHQLDTVVLGPVTGPLSINDVVLYRRQNGEFVLHRIVGLESNGDYVLCGDNQFVLEHHIGYWQMIGRLQAFTRKGRFITNNSLSYKAYICLLPALRLLKHVHSFSWRYMSTIKHWGRHRANGNR